MFHGIVSSVTSVPTVVASCVVYFAMRSKFADVTSAVRTAPVGCDTITAKRAAASRSRPRDHRRERNAGSEPLVPSAHR